MLQSGFQQRFCCLSLFLRTRTAASRLPRPLLKALPRSCCALRYALSISLLGAITRFLCCRGFGGALPRLLEPEPAPLWFIPACLILEELQRDAFLSYSPVLASLVRAPSVDPNDQKKTACYDIDVEVDDTLKTQMNSFLLSTASQQEIAALDNKVGKGSFRAALLLLGGDVSGAGKPLPGRLCWVGLEAGGGVSCACRWMPFPGSAVLKQMGSGKMGVI